MTAGTFADEAHDFRLRGGRPLHLASCWCWRRDPAPVLSWRPRSSLWDYLWLRRAR